MEAEIKRVEKQQKEAKYEREEDVRIQGKEQGKNQEGQNEEREKQDIKEEMGERFKGSIRNQLNYSELIVESKAPYQEDYQIRMIRENSIANIVQVTSCGQDNGTQYIYDVKGMKTLEAEFSKMQCNKLNIELFMKQLLKVIDEMGNYMLNLNCIVLDPNYIFLKDGEYYFCYYPENVESMAVEFHKLTEFFVKTIDYGDYPSVMLACGLHKETMEESYDLREVIEKNTSNHSDVEKFEDVNIHTRSLEAREQLQRKNTLWINEMDYNPLESVQ